MNLLKVQKFKKSNAPFFNFVHNVGYLKYFFETSGTVLVQLKKLLMTAIPQRLEDSVERHGHTVNQNIMPEK
jgi:hypothetical protein